MEQNKWVDDRMAKLNPDGEWKPHVTTGLARFEGRRAQERFIGRVPRALSVVAVAAICVLTFPQPRAFAQKVLAPCVEACQNFALSRGDIHEHLYRLMLGFHQFLGLNPPAVRAESKRKIAADFQLTDATGANFRLADYKGKVVLLSFWASWCTPCKAEIPWFVELQRTRASEGFAVIGISLDEDGWKAVRPVLESEKVNYRVAIGDDALVQQYGGIDSLPETLLIDREGRIAARHVGIQNKVEYAMEVDYVLGKT